jgi:GxxExxY protein
MPVGMAIVSDPLVEKVIGCATTVHRVLGPGLLETVYGRCLCVELRAMDIPFRTEVIVPVIYGNLRLDNGHRIDLLVDKWLVVEIKSVERLLPIHTAQVLTYLRLADAKQGLILNFNAPRLKDGLKSVILRDAVPSISSIP